jgi:hypothetical protein
MPTRSYPNTPASAIARPRAMPRRRPANGLDLSRSTARDGVPCVA